MSEGPILSIIPLRDMVLVELQPEPIQSVLQVLREPRAVRAARVVAVGPEVRDLTVDMMALVNQVSATAINGYWLVPERSVLGTL